jgi:hypothetical protein
LGSVEVYLEVGRRTMMELDVGGRARSGRRRGRDLRRARSEAGVVEEVAEGKTRA